MGRSQMANVAAYLKTKQIAAIYCSPLARAMESARILASAGGWPLKVVFDLRELDFGDYVGLTFEAIAQRDPEFCSRWMNDPTDAKFPGGECYRDVRARVLKAVRAIRRQQRGQTSAIVSHAGVNRLLIADALGLPPARLFRLGQDYAAVNMLRFFGDVPSVQLMNYCAEPDEHTRS